MYVNKFQSAYFICTQNKAYCLTFGVLTPWQSLCSLSYVLQREVTRITRYNRTGEMTKTKVAV